MTFFANARDFDINNASFHNNAPHNAHTYNGPYQPTSYTDSVHVSGNENDMTVWPKSGTGQGNLSAASQVPSPTDGIQPGGTPPGIDPQRWQNFLDLERQGALNPESAAPPGVNPQQWQRFLALEKQGALNGSRDLPAAGSPQPSAPNNPPINQVPVSHPYGGTSQGVDVQQLITSVVLALLQQQGPLAAASLASQLPQIPAQAGKVLSPEPVNGCLNVSLNKLQVPSVDATPRPLLPTPSPSSGGHDDTSHEVQMNDNLGPSNHDTSAQNAGTNKPEHGQLPQELQPQQWQMFMTPEQQGGANGPLAGNSTPSYPVLASMGELQPSDSEAPAARLPERKRKRLMAKVLRKFSLRKSKE
ncbi:hypothetical protein NP233_g7473 [Leucocoprinus birnbaumii]|uniref:Uncharacterized protein n=1 Tax=Leucocoprinus birnbaumii TaxID=56174 RepID=A0AAD5VPB5_9AGAR|nr:hypothetical protein NP233_g7473 [Leucocoprinus birnbaumii]